MLHGHVHTLLMAFNGVKVQDTWLQEVSAVNSCNSCLSHNLTVSETNLHPFPCVLAVMPHKTKPFLKYLLLSNKNRATIIFTTAQQ